MNKFRFPSKFCSGAVPGDHLSRSKLPPSLKEALERRHFRFPCFQSFIPPIGIHFTKVLWDMHQSFRNSSLSQDVLQGEELFWSTLSGKPLDVCLRPRGILDLRLMCSQEGNGCNGVALTDDSGND